LLWWRNRLLWWQGLCGTGGSEPVLSAAEGTRSGRAELG
jgi:hypothetical protein